MLKNFTFSPEIKLFKYSLPPILNAAVYLGSQRSIIRSEEKPQTLSNIQDRKNEFKELRDSGKALIDNQLKKPFNACLNKSDTFSGYNGFIIYEIVQAMGKYYLLREWGRTGTTIEGLSKLQFNDEAAAVKAFKKLYYEKTGNKWENQANFEKKAGKHFHQNALDEEVSTLNNPEIDWSRLNEINLDKNVKNMIADLVDIKKMETQLKNYEVFFLIKEF